MALVVNYTACWQRSALLAKPRTSLLTIKYWAVVSRGPPPHCPLQKKCRWQKADAVHHWTVMEMVLSCYSCLSPSGPQSGVPGPAAASPRNLLECRCTGPTRPPASKWCVAGFSKWFSQALQVTGWKLVWEPWVLAILVSPWFSTMPGS